MPRTVNGTGHTGALTVRGKNVRFGEMRPQRLRRADDVDGVRFSKLAEALVEAVRDPGAAQLVLYRRVVGRAQGYAVV